MKKDDLIPTMEGIEIFAERIEEDTQWMVSVRNLREETLDLVLISSTSYDEQGQKTTTTLRHQIGSLLPGETKNIERLDPSLFSFENEYWFSGWSGATLFDHPFRFKAYQIRSNDSLVLAQ